MLADALKWGDVEKKSWGRRMRRGGVRKMGVGFSVFLCHESGKF
jgi:hypothetical protein